FSVMGEDARNGWLRWEPAYLITRTSVVWTPRLQFMLAVKGTPLLAGIDFEAKGMRGRDPITGTLLLGLRL
ncbi:MAG TPA: hypothetical protein VFQ45_21870, partial [Longimicrobium sp.]|nr:hypothetical protein [Longimicrobium sp.]